MRFFQHSFVCVKTSSYNTYFYLALNNAVVLWLHRIRISWAYLLFDHVVWWSYPDVDYIIYSKWTYDIVWPIDPSKKANVWVLIWNVVYQCNNASQTIHWSKKVELIWQHTTCQICADIWHCHQDKMWWNTVIKRISIGYFTEIKMINVSFSNQGKAHMRIPNYALVMIFSFWMFL